MGIDGHPLQVLADVSREHDDVPPARDRREPIRQARDVGGR